MMSVQRTLPCVNLEVNVKTPTAALSASVLGALSQTGQGGDVWTRMSVRMKTCVSMDVET